jgi:PAS domain S-box-containing protein
MAENLRVIIVEDVPADFHLTVRHLRHETWAVEARHVDRRESLEAALEEGGWDLVLSDYSVPGLPFRQTLSMIQARAPEIPVLLFSGSIGEEEAVALMHMGVRDFILKDRPGRLAAAARNAIQEARVDLERRAETKARQASEARYAATFAQAAIGMAQLDLGGHILKANQKLGKILGYTPEELAGMSNAQLSPPGPAEATRARLMNLLEGPATTFTEEKQNIRKDGSLVWISLSVSLVHGPDGRPEYMVAIVEDIQARKDAEEQVRIWQGAFMACTHGIALGEHATGAFAACNPAFAAMLGRTEDEVVGQCTLDIFLSSERESARAHIADVLSGGRTRFESTMVRKDGTPFPVELELVGLMDADGTSRYRVGTVVDTSERREAERVIRDSEALLRSIMDSMGPMLVVLDRTRRIVHVNRSWERFANESGATPATCLGVGQDYLEALGDLGFRDGAASVRAGIEAVIEGHLPRFDMECASQATGFPSWIHLGVTPLAGRSQGLVIIHTNITARRRADQELRASEERFSAVFKASPLAILLTRLSDEVVLDANPAFLALSGREPQEVLGRTTEEFQFWEDPGARREAIEHLQAHGCLRNLRMDFLDAERRRGHALLSTEVVHLGGGGIMVDLFLDLTEALAAQEKEREMERELGHLQRLESVGRLAGGVAHDMNNVLGAILAVSSVLQIEHGDRPGIANLADIIAQAAGRGRDLVQGLTNFSRKEVKDAAPLDLNGILEREADLLEHTTFKRVTIRLDLERPLPEIRGEASALSNVLMNLCVNACDAMPEGGTLTLRSRAASPGWVEIAVEDTGEGMPPEVAARAMEPFFTTKPVGKGTGLGLSIVFGTVKAHGGTVEIRTSPGEGTAVLLGFPTLASPWMPRPQGAEAPEPGDPLRVLLVDDDELIQRTVPELLRSLGHLPMVAGGGQEALRRMEGGAAVDLVILDMDMPGMDGQATLSRIRLLHPALPVIVATGHHDPITEQRISTLPGVRRLAKPFAASDLEAMIGRAHPRD